MKTKSLRAIIFAALLIGIYSCSSIKVVSDYDKDADFTKYKTLEYLGWSDGSDKLINELDKTRIEKSFADEFNNRDIKIVKDGGDLAVSLFLVLDEKTSKTAYTDHYSTGYYRGYYGYRGMGMGHSTTTFQEHDYVVGSIVVDVFDTETKKLVWQGIGSGTVDDNPQTREKNIPKSAAKIMEQFPIASKVK